MGWFSKKEEVPEIPQAPRFSDLNSPTENKELQELPSLPKDRNSNNFNQDLVKSAVNDDSGEEELSNEMPKIPSRPQELSFKEYPSENMVSEEILPAIPLMQKPTNTPAQRITPKVINMPNQRPKEPVQSEEEPIFVRIDRFQAAQKNLDSIKIKIEEMESLLEKINNVKSKEEEELNKWSKEVEEMKSSLASIDSNIFDKI